MNWREAREWLDGHINYERISLKALLNDGPATPRQADAKLERVRKFLDLMGDPHRQYPIVHVAGTDGKTSTVRIITAVLAARGLSVGTHTSPNLEREKITERIGWNGEPITEAALAEVFGALAELEPLVGERCSYFEIFTIAAYRWFADVAVDVAVVEAGMGGRWDATNVGDGAVAVITNVGSDHLDVIGPTRVDVAREKAGIVKPGSTLVLGETDPDLLPQFEAAGARDLWLVGREFDCTQNRPAHGGRLLDIRTPRAEYEGVFLGLHGAYQGLNAACALAAAEAFFDEPLSDEIVEEAFATVQSPGRMEIVGRQPLVILDGAHTAEAAEALSATLDEEFAAVTGRLLIVGFNRGHDMAGILRALKPARFREVFACQVDWPRAVPAAEIAEAVRSAGGEPVVAGTVERALAAAAEAAGPDDLILVTGSLYAAGEARGLLKPAP